MSEQARQKLFLRYPRGNEPILTKRQIEAPSLCAAYPDESLASLADKLSVTGSTIRNLLSNTYLRLGVSHRAAAIAKARQLALITPTELARERTQDRNI